MKRPGQHEDESVMEYLSRAIGHLEYEPCHLLDDLKTVDAVLEFFELWHAYDTDYWHGVLECIAEGDSHDKALAFIAKHKLPKEWKQEVMEAKKLQTA